jgi:hypothetical protein
VKNSFSPDQLHAMRIAYERAVEQLPSTSYEEIAHRIMSAAMNGETDPDRLLFAAKGVVILPSAQLRSKPSDRREEQ